jgi:hypothetical protein
MWHIYLGEVFTGLQFWGFNQWDRGANYPPNEISIQN